LETGPLLVRKKDDMKRETEFDGNTNGRATGRVGLRGLVLAISAVTLLSCACATTDRKKTDAVSGPSPAAQSGSAITDSIEALATPGRVLVVYFSQGNATRTVAEDLAALTGADVEVLVEKKKRSGFFGFMGAGKDATFKIATPIEKPRYSPSDYDTVFVCTPVWSWSLCPPVRTWLRMFKGTIPRAVYATVSGDTDPDKIVRSMVKEVGVEPLTFAGFAERDFYPENREGYIKKIAALLDPLR